MANDAHIILGKSINLDDDVVTLSNKNCLSSSDAEIITSLDTFFYKGCIVEKSIFVTSWYKGDLLELLYDNEIIYASNISYYVRNIGDKYYEIYIVIFDAVFNMTGYMLIMDCSYYSLESSLKYIIENIDKILILHYGD